MYEKILRKAKAIARDIHYHAWFSTPSGGANTAEYAGDTWYVRPSGGNYNKENGTTYLTAWDGFSNIDWTLIKPGDILYVCGTHKEAFSVGASGTSGRYITIRGDFSSQLYNDPGVIDSENTRVTGFDCNNRNYIQVTALTSKDATTDCFQFRGTSSNIITNRIRAIGTANQGIQHENSASVTHNNPYCHNNIDDGISGHDNATIVVSGGTFTDNGQGINIIDNVHCTVTGNTTFSGNTLDIWAANATTEGSAWINITGTTLPVSAVASAKAKLFLTNCTISGTLKIGVLAGNAYLEATGCTVSGAASFGSGGNSTITNCSFTSTVACGAGTTVAFDSCLITQWTGQVGGDITLSDCYVKDNNTYNDSLTAEYTLFEGGSDHLCDIDNGCAATFKYCIFDSMASAKFGIAGRTGSSLIINGCTFVDSAGNGKGIYTQIDVTANNCIFTSLAAGVHQAAGTVATYNCVFYDNTANTAGVVSQNASQAGDPKLNNVSGNDFSLQSGSSAIANGKNLGTNLDDGINTAVWGNGTQTPTVTTKQQSTNWDIGAYLS